MMVIDTAIQSRLNAMLAEMVQKPVYSSVLLAVQSASCHVDYRGVQGVKDGDTNTPYFIASITKLYTAAVVLKLHDTGKLHLSDAIAHHLPADIITKLEACCGADNVQAMTIEHLLRHTSGIPDYFEGKGNHGSLLEHLKAGMDEPFDVRRAVDIATQQKATFGPTSGRASYSDTNYQLLGAIIESVTADSLGDAYAAYIFTPLGLTNTWLYQYPLPLNQDEPLAFQNKLQTLTIPQSMMSFWADGGLVSTLDDQLVFLRGIFEGRLFDAGLLDAMQTDWKSLFFPLSYGMGMMRFALPWWMSPFSPQPELRGHAGASGSFAFYVPQREMYIVGTLNQLDQPQRMFTWMLRVLRVVAKETR